MVNSHLTKLTGGGGRIEIYGERCWSMEERKSKLGLGIFIGVLIGLVIGLTSFIVYDKIANNGSKNGSSTNKSDDTTFNIEEEKLSVDDNLVSKLFEIVREDKFDFDITISSINDVIPYITLRQIPESVKNYISCDNLDTFASNNINYCGDDFNNDMIQAIDNYGRDSEQYKKAIEKNKTLSVSEDVFNKKLKEIFGQNSVYNADEKVYAYYGCSCGGLSYKFEQKVVDAIKKNNTVIIKTNKTNDSKIENIVYTFELEKSTGNYIYISREAI